MYPRLDLFLLINITNYGYLVYESVLLPAIVLYLTETNSTSKILTNSVRARINLHTHGPKKVQSKLQFCSPQQKVATACMRLFTQ